MVDSRNKGKAGELEARAKLQLLLADPTIQRVLDQPRDGGYDLDGEKLAHFAVEVKRTSTPRLMEWFDGLAGQAPICDDRRIPMIMWRPGDTSSSWTSCEWCSTLD